LPPLSPLFPYTTLFRSCPFSHCLLLLAGAPRPARVAPLAGPRRPAPLRDLPNFSYRHMLTGPVPHSPSRDVKPFALCPDSEVSRSEEHTSELQSHLNLV